MQGNDAIKNATSILDYVFRELAISYLGRNDLAHISPDEIGNTVLGGGVDQDKAPGFGEGASASPAAASVVSRGLVRSKADKLMLVPARAGDASGSRRRLRRAWRLRPGRDRAQGRTRRARRAGVGSSLAPQVETVAEKRAEARMKGYVGESCPECGNFTMVRNGTCLKCDTCGGTTGCS